MVQSPLLSQAATLFSVNKYMAITSIGEKIKNDIVGECLTISVFCLLLKVPTNFVHTPQKRPFLWNKLLIMAHLFSSTVFLFNVHCRLCVFWDKSSNKLRICGNKPICINIGSQRVLITIFVPIYNRL